MLFLGAYLMSMCVCMSVCARTCARACEGTCRGPNTGSCEVGMIEGCEPLSVSDGKLTSSFPKEQHTLITAELSLGALGSCFGGMVPACVILKAFDTCLAERGH